MFVQAVTKDGRTIKVPSNYFLTTSVTFAQGRIGLAKMRIAGHLPVRTFGNVRTKNKKKLAEQCLLPLVENDPETRRRTVEKIGNMANFIKRHHMFVMSRVNEEGRLSYDLFPHHIWSNPFEYTEFERLDKRTILGYRIVIESVCLNFEYGELKKRTIAKTDHYVDVTDI